MINLYKKCYNKKITNKYKYMNNKMKIIVRYYKKQKMLK